jgi:hypothetical protein
MSDILRRTVFINPKGGYMRPRDWAVVQTALGPMAEPFNLFERHVYNAGLANFDSTEPQCMVNDVVFTERDDKQLIGDTVHGGCMTPRVGY